MHENYDCIIAGNGVEAIEKFKAEKPSLVLLDVMMPKMDGWEACRKIREIDNTPGTISKVRDVPNDADLFNFFYQKDMRTTVQGGVVFTWDQTVPLLRTINVTSSSAP